MTDFAHATLIRCPYCGLQFCPDEGYCPDCGPDDELAWDEYETPEDEK
jgi:uncharacterized OB-fold protein